MSVEALRERFTLTDKPADEYLPWHGHVADDVVLLEDGTHLAVVRLDGQPMSLMDDPARYAERRRRHAALRALADTNVTISGQYIIGTQIYGRYTVGRAYASRLA